MQPRRLVVIGLLVTAVAGSAAAAEEPEPLYLDFLRPPRTFVTPPQAPEALTAGGFTISLNFTGGLTLEQRALFTAAKERWESRIIGYPAGVGLSGIVIDASGVSLDGVGGILGSAGPTNYTIRNGTYYTTRGEMEFDSADIASMVASGSFDEVVEHEMGHVIGIGIWWSYNGDYVEGSGRYTGPAGLAGYRGEFVGQGAAGWVPVELEGGGGTANGHWDEGYRGASTGILDPLGRDKRHELMTGWLNMPVFYSRTTHAHLQDLGYTVADLWGGTSIFSDGFEGGVAAWSGVTQ